MGVQLSQEELDELVEETRAEALKEAAKACDLVAKEIDDTNGWLHTVVILYGI